jgi:hypothetical protein
MKESTVDFNYLLQKDSWQECPSNSDVNINFHVFMDTILNHYITEFPLKPFQGSNREK